MADQPEGEVPGPYAGPPPTSPWRPVDADQTGAPYPAYPPPGYPPSGYSSPGYPPPGYPPPGYPPPGFPPPGFPPPGYPTSGHAPTGYPPPYPPPGYPYPPPGYPFGVAPQDPRDRRPGTATAAAVLGYVNAGFMIICAIVLFAGASVVHDIDRYNGDDHNAITTELTIDAVLNLLAAGLLIGGAVALTNRSPVGRMVYSVGAALVVGMSIYWITRFHNAATEAFVFYSLLFAAIAIVGAVLAWVRGATVWLASKRE